MQLRALLDLHRLTSGLPTRSIGRNRPRCSYDATQIAALYLQAIHCSVLEHRCPGLIRPFLSCIRGIAAMAYTSHGVHLAVQRNSKANPGEMTCLAAMPD